MVEKTIKIITGKVEEDIYGSWSDCTTGIFIDSTTLNEIFYPYKGKTIKVTIEETEDKGE